MPRCLPVLAALLCSAALTDESAAQSPATSPIQVQASAGMASGVLGVVTDESGVGIHGASVLAMGATLAVVRTDTRGHFQLDLAPGRYILRATRDGYISTYREAVQIRSNVPLTRAITLLRADDGVGEVALASLAQPIVEPVEVGPAEPATCRARRFAIARWRPGSTTRW